VATDFLFSGSSGTFSFQSGLGNTGVLNFSWKNKAKILVIAPSMATNSFAQDFGDCAQHGN
jgi:hypothetical protein